MVLKQYKCKFCQNEFEREVRYLRGDVNPNTKFPGKRNAISDQVKCPKCCNLITTWEKINLGDNKTIKVRD
jgi:rubredoxin